MNTRDCNGCTVCCDACEVRSLGKPHHTMCTRCIPGVGCSDYATRPRDCAEFSCAYPDGTRPLDTWPKTCGFLQRKTRNKLVGIVWTLCEHVAGSLESDIAQREIRWALDERYFVFLERKDGTGTYIIPTGAKVSTSALLFSGPGIEFVSEKKYFGEEHPAPVVENVDALVKKPERWLEL